MYIISRKTFRFHNPRKPLISVGGDNPRQGSHSAHDVFFETVPGPTPQQVPDWVQGDKDTKSNNHTNYLTFNRAVDDGDITEVIPRKTVSGKKRSLTPDQQATLDAAARAASGGADLADKAATESVQGAEEASEDESEEQSEDESEEEGELEEEEEPENPGLLVAGEATSASPEESLNRRDFVAKRTRPKKKARK